jgi:hypothetical protein
VEAPGSRLRTHVGRRPAPLSVRLDLPPGISRVRLRTDAPALRAEHDRRRLHLRLTEPRVELERAAVAVAAG